MEHRSFLLLLHRIELMTNLGFQVGKQRHESVGQVLGLPRSGLEWEEASRVTWDKNLEGPECLAKPCSPEGSGSHRRLWSKARDAVRASGGVGKQE